MVTWPDCSSNSNILRRRPSTRSRELLESDIACNQSLLVARARDQSNSLPYFGFILRYFLLGFRLLIILLETCFFYVIQGCVQKLIPNGDAYECPPPFFLHSDPVYIRSIQQRSASRPRHRPRHYSRNSH